MLEISWNLSSSLFFSPYPIISPAFSCLLLHYFEHSFHFYLSLSLLISKWEPTVMVTLIKGGFLLCYSNDFVWYKIWKNIHWNVIEDTYPLANVFVFKDILPIDLFKSLFDGVTISFAIILDQLFIRRWIFNKKIKFPINYLVMAIWI